MKIDSIKKLDKTQKILLSCIFIDEFLACLSYPAIRKVTGELLPTRYFAIEGIIIFLSSIIACSLWNNKNFRIFLFKIYKLLAILEILGFISLGITQFLWFNICVFSIGTLCFGSIICVFLGRILNSFRVSMFPDRKREFFDNNRTLVENISELVGLGIAAIFPISLKTSIILWSIGIASIIGWLIIYKRNKIKLSKIEENT